MLFLQACEFLGHSFFLNFSSHGQAQAKFFSLSNLMIVNYWGGYSFMYAVFVVDSLQSALESPLMNDFIAALEQLTDPEMWFKVCLHELCKTV